MKTIASMLTVLMLALLLAVPASAAGDVQGETVTKTFELTLHGRVPQDRAFAAYYSTDVTNVGGEPTDYILFCGGTESDRAGARQVVSQEDCAGDGRVYRARVEFERGARLVYFFIVAVEGTDNFEIFHTNVPSRESKPELLSADTTSRAWYRFGAGNDQQVPGMPATGAGGMSGAGVPLAENGLVLTLLVVAGCAALGMRRWSARSAC
jgi:hypothetical protein